MVVADCTSRLMDPVDNNNNKNVNNDSEDEDDVFFNEYATTERTSEESTILTELFSTSSLKVDIRAKSHTPPPKKYLVKGLSRQHDSTSTDQTYSEVKDDSAMTDLLIYDIMSPPPPKSPTPGYSQINHNRSSSTQDKDKKQNPLNTETQYQQTCLLFTSMVLQTPDMDTDDSYLVARTTCVDLLVKGYLRINMLKIYLRSPMEIIPFLIAYIDPLLRWCLPIILTNTRKNGQTIQSPRRLSLASSNSSSLRSSPTNTPLSGNNTPPLPISPISLSTSAPSDIDNLSSSVPCFRRTQSQTYRCSSFYHNNNSYSISTTSSPRYATNRHRLTRSTCSATNLFNNSLQKHLNHLILNHEIVINMNKYINDLNITNDHFQLYIEKKDWQRLFKFHKYIVHDILLYGTNLRKNKKKLSLNQRSISMSNATTNHHNLVIHNEREETKNAFCNFDFKSDLNSMDSTMDTREVGDASYDITIKNEDFFASNLNDIQWLSKIISRNNRLLKLQISNATNLTNFYKFHYFVQNSFLLSELMYPLLTEICIDSCKKFNHECLLILLHAIQRKCFNVTHLSLFRTSITSASCHKLISFLTANQTHPLWNIDLEFCVKIDDAGVEKWATFLRLYPNRNFFIKITHRALNDDRIFEEQRLLLSLYP